VIVSAYGDPPNIRAAMNRGAFDFLAKPIDFDDFDITLRKTLDRLRRRRAAAADRDRLLVLERDLQIAAEIQRSFLPPAGGGGTDLAVYAAMVPARTVGGDFYDPFLVGRGRLAVVVGDVAGKGVAAALLMAVTRTLLCTAALRGCDPGECLEQVNTGLLRESTAERFVTLCYAVLDVASGALHWVSARHPPAYLLRAGGTVEELPGHGLVVGAFAGVTYETSSVRLAPGDRVFLYTDGVTEAMNPTQEQFSGPRLHGVLREVEGAAPEQVVARVVEAVRRFTAGALQSDDLTAMAVLYRGPGGGGP
jgi:sigma-B regulation protein RsbU (phosphoserine phosphatase)